MRGNGGKLKGFPLSSKSRLAKIKTSLPPLVVLIVTEYLKLHATNRQEKKYLKKKIKKKKEKKYQESKPK